MSTVLKGCKHSYKSFIWKSPSIICQRAKCLKYFTFFDAARCYYSAFCSAQGDGRGGKVFSFHYLQVNLPPSGIEVLSVLKLFPEFMKCYEFANSEICSFPQSKSPKEVPNEIEIF